MSITLVNDATHANIGSLPKGMLAAGYDTGSADIKWTPADWAAHPGAVHYDQDTGASFYTADLLDVETGAATPADAPRWHATALLDYKNGHRPGQRYPGIYVNQSNMHLVANAFVAAKYTAIVPLAIAEPNLAEATAIAEVSNPSGPFPIISIQFKFGGTFDTSVMSTSWLDTVSKAPIPPPSQRTGILVPTVPLGMPRTVHSADNGVTWR